MKFQFSQQDRTITVHHLNSEGVYLSSSEMLIEANTGLPANSTVETLPDMATGQVAIYHDGQWTAKQDYRGRVAYAKDRVDSVNFTVADFSDLPDSHTLDEPGEFDSWTEDTGWQYDIERERPVKTAEERHWRDGKLASVLSRIDQYEKDKNYPAELRASPIKSEDDFLKLLSDRKLLSDYPSTENFPFGTRPMLSNIIS